MYCWPSCVRTRAASSFLLDLVSRKRLSGVSGPVVTQPASTNIRPTDKAARSSRMGGPLIQTFAEFGLASRAIEHLPFQLTASRIDVVAAGATQHRQDAGIEQLGLESADDFDVRTLEARARKWIKGNQVDLAVGQATHQLDQLARVLGLVVDTLHQGVFEGDRRTRLACEPAQAGSDELGDRITLVERHQLGAQLVVGRMQRYRQRHV